MKKSFLLLGAMLMVLAVTGCATTGAAYAPVQDVPAEQAIIYVYRIPAFTGSAISYDVKLNGEFMGKLKNGAYFYAVVDPGSHVLSAKTEVERTVDINVEAGETYYVRGGVVFGVMVGRPSMLIIPNETAENEITECKMENK